MRGFVLVGSACAARRVLLVLPDAALFFWKGGGGVGRRADARGYCRCAAAGACVNIVEVDTDCYWTAGRMQDGCGKAVGSARRYSECLAESLWNFSD